MKMRRSVMQNMGFLGMLLLVTVGWADGQVRYVRPLRAGDGTSWVSAAGSIQQMIDAGATEVRVGEGTYSLPDELVIPVGVRVIGGYSSDSERRMGSVDRTVLDAGGKFRVATVAGVLEGVTVINGFAEWRGMQGSGTGGGVYIKGTGLVRNCVIKDNYAGRYYPKVGDVQMKDRSFKPFDEIDVTRDWEDIRGIVFWVNPDSHAAEGNKGWLVAKQLYMPCQWSQVSGGGQCTESTYSTWKEAVSDTAGARHSAVMLSNGAANLEAVRRCADYRVYAQSEAEWSAAEAGVWYLPALGQLRVLWKELAWVIPVIRLKYGDDAFSSLNYLQGAYWSSSEVMGGDKVWVLDYSELTEWGMVATAPKDGNLRVSPVTSF